MEAIISLILSVFCETTERDSAVSSVIFAPLFTASMVSSISPAVFWAAFADFCARFPTSSATTAKPFPAAPALAASMAAFKDKILVWKAISSMVLIILLISCDFSVISCIALDISSIFSLLSPTALPLSLERIEAFMDIEVACSVAPRERDCAKLLTCCAEASTCCELP